MPIGSLVGLVQILADKGASQVGPRHVEVPVNSLHPSSLGGVPCTGMEILNVFSECSGLISRCSQGDCWLLLLPNGASEWCSLLLPSRASERCSFLERNSIEILGRI